MKLIIRAPNWVGDGIMALPAIDNARDMTGASHIGVMARSTTASLYENHPDVSRVIRIDDKSSRVWGAKRAAALIKDEKYDIGIILPPSFSSALIFKLGKIRGRIGFAGDIRSMLLSRAIKSPTEKMHRIDEYLYLLEKMTGNKMACRPPVLYLSHDDITAGGKILKKHSLSYDDKFIAIAPQAIAPSRRWGADNYGQLAKRLVADFDCRVVLIGTSGNYEAGKKTRSYDERNIINLCGETSLLAAASILSFAKVFVGNDSGLAHLAGAVNCPIVVLSGADDPEETSPRCEKKFVVIKDDLDCISCVRNQCRLKGDDFMKCMNLILVDEVFDAAKKIISR
ncbi:MAG: lipopolysaccharide heptosyltransferase II [candidate division Zixibacteria bacterium]